MSLAFVDDAVGRWTEQALPLAGRVREVVRAPAGVLATPGVAVDPADPDVVRLAADLVATMRVSPGCVGLAAPQVGVSAKVFCVDVGSHPRTRAHHGTFVLCNARVVEASRNEKAREGCMSVPDLTGDVKRATRLVVAGQLPGTGEEVQVEANAFEARALQHEIDHCEGLLFLDRVAGLLADGTLRPHVTEVLPLDRAREALDLNQQGRSHGKVVLEVG